MTFRRLWRLRSPTARSPWTAYSVPSAPPHSATCSVDPTQEWTRFTNYHSLTPALVALPIRERDILIMRFYGDMTQTQIAAKLGLSQMHVSRLLATTLALLREAVDNDIPLETEGFDAPGFDATVSRSSAPV